MRTFEQRLRDELAPALDTEPTVAPGPELVARVDAAQLPGVVQRLREEFGAVFVDLFGVDARGRGGGLELHLLFALDRRTVMLSEAKHLPGRGEETLRSAQGDNEVALYREPAWLHLVAPIDGDRSHGLPLPEGNRQAWGGPQNSELRTQNSSLGNGRGEGAPHPSLTSLLPAAGWYERESRGEVAIDLVEAPAGVVDYPLGPVRSGVVESVHYGLRTVGEELVDVRLQPFYKHRGIEKMAESFPLVHLPLLAERISGTSAFAHSLALCQALEAAAGAEVPARARFLRTILAEVERLYNHLGYHADLCQATGLVVGQAQMDILKERLLRLNAAIAGHRYLFGMNVAGGLARDLGADALDAVKRAIEDVRLEMRTLEPMLLGSSSHLDRLEGTGILTPGDATAYGAVGPVGRASGVDRDLRRDHPYAAYAEAGFEVPIYQTGDALARARVRLEEIHQSLRIIEQLLDRVPGGPVRTAVGEVPAGTTALGWVESPRGEGVHWILVGDGNTLSRYRMRPASFANAQVFPLAVPGHNILTDFPIIEQSFALSFAGCDR